MFKMFSRHKKILFLLLLTCMVFTLTAESGKHSITLEYIPVILPLLAGGSGMGLGYDYQLNDCFSLRATGFGAFLPINKEGFISLAGGAAAVQIYPEKSGGEGLFSMTGLGFLYFSAQGEDRFGGLESHFIFIYAQETVGWRFILGDGKIRFLIQPELNFRFVFPGITGSGYKDNLVWTNMGVALAALYPNLIMGINF